MLLNLPTEILLMILNNLTLFESKNLFLINQTFKEIMLSSKKYKKIKLQLFQLINPLAQSPVQNRFEIHNSNWVEYHQNDQNGNPINLMIEKSKNNNDIYVHIINYSFYKKEIKNIDELIKYQKWLVDTQIVFPQSMHVGNGVYMKKFEFYHIILESIKIINFINEKINL